METKSEFARRIRQARGEEAADCVLKNCRIVDVFCGDIVQADVAICGEMIAGIGSYSGVKEIECNKSYISPGFLEGHIHVESSMLSPNEFANTVLSHGTTTVICDPHEIANVAGKAGIEYMLAESNDHACDLFVMAPSCVPATHLENSGAALDVIDMKDVCGYPRVIGIAEMMNYPGVLFADTGVLDKLLLSQGLGLQVDGHAPGLNGKDLQAYVGAGIRSDHECTTAKEAREKLRAGMFLFIREGSTAKNLEALLPVVTERNSRRCLLVTDDCHPGDLLTDGHLDRILRKAISLGLDPITAIQMVTINVSDCFLLSDRGAVAPGYRADLVLFDELSDIRPRMVFSSGRQVEKGQLTTRKQKAALLEKFPQVFHSVHVDLQNLSFRIPAEGETGRVIGVQKDQLVTDSLKVALTIKGDEAVADCTRDLLKIAVIERHRATGNIGLGFVRGVGLQRGALASSVAHDSHNIIVIGADDKDMELAVRTVAGFGGGLAVVAEGRVMASLPLQVAGLMSTAPAQEVAGAFSVLLGAASELGGQVADPFMLMSFLALPVIPHLKMTDLGLVDVDAFESVGLWV